MTIQSFLCKTLPLFTYNMVRVYGPQTNGYKGTTQHIY